MTMITPSYLGETIEYSSLHACRSTLEDPTVALAIAIAGCGSAIPGNSVAVMAGNPITTQAFNHWMYVAAKQEASQSPGQPVIVPNDPPNFAHCIAQVRAQIPALKKTPDKTIKADCKQLFTSLSGQVLDFLIKAYWFQADAHKAGVNVTPAAVQKALAAAKKGQFSTAAQFQNFLTSTGQTLADVAYRVKVQQIYAKLLAKHPTTVTDAAIANYYKAHQAQFGSPQTRSMRIVLTKTQAEALKAEALLRHGASWKAIAKKYSIDPTTKNNGGVLTNVTEGQQDAALSNAAFSASKNQILGPIHGQFGYYVLEVTGIKPATVRTLAQSSTLIKQTLQQQLQTAAENAVTNHAKKDWLAKTKCRELYSMADCAGYKAPKTPTTPAAPAAPATPAAPSSAP